MLCLLHGYSLDGSGSNLWTRSMLEALCREGKQVHLCCQEAHPERFDFISEAYQYDRTLQKKRLFRRKIQYPGKVIFHRPDIGPLIPVYIGNAYVGFASAKPMPDLTEEEIEHYIEANAALLRKLVTEANITYFHVNHAVLLSASAQRVHQETNTPYAILPHGSDLEYVIKKDVRFKTIAKDAMASAEKLFCVSSEMETRLTTLFSDVGSLKKKIQYLGIGVDTWQFQPMHGPNQIASYLEHLEIQLKKWPPGKSPSHSELLLRGLTGELSQKRYQALINGSRSYASKAPDSDALQKLRSVVEDRKHPLGLFVGRLLPAKGIHCLLLALPKILEQCPDFRLIVVGNGPLREPLEALLWALRNGNATLVEKILAWGMKEEPAYYEPALNYWKAQDDSFQTLCRRHLKDDRVTFLGYFGHRELALTYPLCQAAIFPSIVIEAGPMVFLEALSSGCFPIGTEQGGMGAQMEILRDGMRPEDGALLGIGPQSDKLIDDLIKKVPLALKKQATYRDHFRQKACAHFDWKVVGENLLALATTEKTDQS